MQKIERILFIIPPYIGYDNFVRPSFNERVVVKKGGSFGSVVTDMPIGVLSMSAYLKAHANVEIRLIDFNLILNRMEYFNHRSFEDLFREVLSEKEWLDYNPSIIGISVLFTPSYYSMMGIGSVAREIFPSSLVIAGGGVPTNMYKEIFSESSCFDALCFGEGENPLLELVNASHKMQFLREHPSWITRDKIEDTQLFERDFIENLDEIPFYDYDLLSIRDYELSPTISSYASFTDARIFNFATSRGCVHRCCFCSSHTVHGRRMRYHSVQRVRRDLLRLRDEFGAKIIAFQDDHFMGDKQRALEIISIMKELKLNVLFQSGLALHALDRTMLEAIKDAGLDHLLLSIESGSNRVLREIMHKPLNLSIVNRVVADCRDLGIDTDANILIGLPGETRQDIEETRAYFKTLDATWFRIYIATPLVGSEMLDVCVRKGYLKGSHIGSDFKHAVVETEEFTPEWLRDKVYALNLELNFVYNSDFRLGNYVKALQGFENTIRVKEDHAIAHYYAALCYEKLGDKMSAERHMEIARSIVGNDPFWRNYADMFSIPI